MAVRGGSYGSEKGELWQWERGVMAMRGEFW